MRIHRTQIRNLDRYLSALPPGSSFKVIVDVEEKTLARAGFDPAAENGDTVLPPVVGRVSRFNAEGRWITRRDLPKELRYVGSRSWLRTEWHGPNKEEVEDTVDINRWCYPRDLLAPPSIELTYVEHDGSRLITSPDLQYVVANSEANKHVINLMLELFGSCEIARGDLERLTPPRLRRANWVMLPPGDDPFGRIEAHIKGVYGGRSPSIAKVAMMRQQVVLAHRPSEVVMGQAGFSDYLAYIFNDRGLVVLESVRYGNALYVLGDKWQDLSKFTKAEIIRHGLAEDRIIHSKGWVAHLATVMRPKAAE